MRVLYRALASLFLAAGILAILAYLPLCDGYQYSCFWGLERFFPVLFMLLLAALLFLSLAAWCHRQANRRRFLR